VKEFPRKKSDFAQAYRVAPNNAFERSVMRRRGRAASALVHCAPAARVMRQRAAAQRER
jgi:hypothetical protein